MDSDKDKQQNPEVAVPQTEGPVHIGEAVKEVVNDLLQQALHVREARQADLDEQLSRIEFLKDLKRDAAGMQDSLLRLQNVRIKGAEQDLEAVNNRLASPIVIPPVIPTNS